MSQFAAEYDQLNPLPKPPRGDDARCRLLSANAKNSVRGSKWRVDWSAVGQRHQHFVANIPINRHIHSCKPFHSCKQLAIVIHRHP
jgi:hypothetical protein